MLLHNHLQLAINGHNVWRDVLYCQFLSLCLNCKILHPIIAQIAKCLNIYIINYFLSTNHYNLYLHNLKTIYTNGIIEIITIITYKI